MAVMGAVYFLWPAPPIVTGPPLPSPNGYDDFVKAGAMLTTLSAGYTKMTKEELKAYVGTNQEPLRLLRLGLTRECQVPTEDSMDYYEKQVTNWPSIKGLARLIAAEGRLAEAEERFVDAARIHQENVRYGQIAANGGLMIDKLVGIAVENIGMVGLERVVDKLDARQAREFITSLGTVDARSTPASIFIARDRQWGRKATDTSAFSAWILSTVLSLHRQTDQKFTTKLQATDLRRRKLMLDMASRVHELETGKRPQQTSDLVPGILRAIPKDPGTSADLPLPESK